MVILVTGGTGFIGSHTEAPLVGMEVRYARQRSDAVRDVQLDRWVQRLDRYCHH